VKLVLAAAAALLLVPVVLVAAAVGALGGGSDPTAPGGARGAPGLVVAAAQAGFTGQGLRLAVAVGLAESDGDPTARNPNPPTPGCPAGSTDRGAWQLNNCYHPEVADACADQLACAAEATYRISAAGSDWHQWTTFISSAYRAQLGAADQALATLAAPSAAGGVPPGYGTPGPCGLSPATDYTKHLVTELFGITDIGGCALFSGHVENSDHYPDANGQAHAIDVMVGTNSALGWQVATWAAANAAALHVKYVLFAGQIIDFREPTPAWHACRDPASSCAQNHFNHVHISFSAS
jgi:hypothetical protein